METRQTGGDAKRVKSVDSWKDILTSLTGHKGWLQPCVCVCVSWKEREIEQAKSKRVQCDSSSIWARFSQLGVNGDFRAFQIKVLRSQRLIMDQLALTRARHVPLYFYFSALTPAEGCEPAQTCASGFAQAHVQMEVICLWTRRHMKVVNEGQPVTCQGGEVRAHPSISTFLPQSARFTLVCWGERTVDVCLHKRIWQHILLRYCYVLSCINKFAVFIFLKWNSSFLSIGKAFYKPFKTES